MFLHYVLNFPIKVPKNVIFETEFLDFISEVLSLNYNFEVEQTYKLFYFR